MIIGYTTGVFDMFHIGHLNILRRAKEQCDYLIVGVSTDELVQHDKNKTPIIPFENRCKIVEAIKYVDKVVPQPDKNKFAAWEKYHFNKMFVGSDWQGTPQCKGFEEQFAPLGVEIVYLSHTDGISSTILREVLNGVKIGGGEIVGYTQGVYDMFHIGHLNLLQHAKEKCDYLVVGINSDTLVQSYKHKKPIIAAQERAAIIASLKMVDCCYIVDTLDKNVLLESVGFDKIFIGSDWLNDERWIRTKTEMSEKGVDVEFLPHTDGISSTLLREKLN